MSEPRPIEPMVRINHTGYGIKLATVIQLATLVFVGGGAYFAVDSKLSHLGDTLQRIADTAETARKERDAETQGLRRRIANAEQSNARLEAQVNNVERVLEDLRDLLREHFTQKHPTRASW